jgi:hypothetical protein
VLTKEQGAILEMLALSVDELLDGPELDDCAGLWSLVGPGLTGSAAPGWGLEHPATANAPAASSRLNRITMVRIRQA